MSRVLIFRLGLENQFDRRDTRESASARYSEISSASEQSQWLFQFVSWLSWILFLSNFHKNEFSVEKRQSLLKECTKDWSNAPPGTVKNAFGAIHYSKNPVQRIQAAFNAIVKMVTHYVRDCYGGGPWKKQANEIVNEIKMIYYANEIK